MTASEALKLADSVRPLTNGASIKESEDHFTITDMWVMILVYRDGEIRDLTDC